MLSNLMMKTIIWAFNFFFISVQNGAILETEMVTNNAKRLWNAAVYTFPD